jgi:aerobic-type carbon monoxide dehydrogenase small subunit (CoxS/CutS family)
MSTEVVVNGRTRQLRSDPATPLLYVLRNELQLNGAKFGCGYCIAGMIMRGQALLDKIAHPSDEQIRAHMEPNLCRCGTHTRILAAIREVAHARAGAA